MFLHSGVKICPQESVSDVVASHQTYYQLRGTGLIVSDGFAATGSDVILLASLASAAPSGDFTRGAKAAAEGQEPRAGHGNQPVARVLLTAQ